ncbi:DUF262 domain-containing protein [Campylobacter coli]
MASNKSMLSSDEITNILKEKQKNIKYDTKDWSIELVLSKFHKQTEKNQTEINIPFYQRNFVWKPDQISKLIETILLGLPLPLIFLEQTDDGLLEVIDGSQRIRALDKFFNNEHKLNKLEILGDFNGMKFEDFPPSIQRKMKDSSLRIIVLESNEEENAKDIANKIFERINTKGTNATAMEVRKGSNYGKFVEFIYSECSTEEFENIAKLGKTASLRGYQQELIIKFFAYYDLYIKSNKIEFNETINAVLENYMKEKNKSFDDDDKNKDELLTLFKNVIKIIERCKITENDSYKLRKKDKLLAIMLAIAIYIKEDPNYANKTFDVWSQDFINNSNNSSLKTLNDNIKLILNNLKQ